MVAVSSQLSVVKGHRKDADFGGKSRGFKGKIRVQRML
jgi:hypothetical protein